MGADGTITTRPSSSSTSELGKARDPSKTWTNQRNAEIETENSLGLKENAITPETFTRDEHGEVRELRFKQAFMFGIHEVTQTYNQQSAGTHPINFKNSCNRFVSQPVFQYAR